MKQKQKNPVGRPKTDNPYVTRSMRWTRDGWERIPKPKSKFVRDAVCEKIVRKERGIA
jgi:hypothetical protein